MDTTITRLISFLSATTNLQKLAFVLCFRNSLVLQPGANRLLAIGR